MNIQDYISSGIVESYVLGLAEPAERAEFEQLCLEYPELIKARTEFEIQLEEQVFADSVQPPAELMNAVISALDFNSLNKASVDPLSASPVIPRYTVPVEATEQAGKVKKMMTRMQYLAAACFILLVASTSLNFYFFRQYRDYSVLYKDLLSEREQFASANNVMQTKLQSYETALSVIKDKDVKVVSLPGSNVPTSPNPASLATVYWNQRTRDVYLLVNNMPLPASDKQYQLWALVDGKPINAGVFDAGDPTAFIRMKNIPNAQAFAITLEKKGGAVSPTMDQMYVLGKI
ncbi:MAG: anti-sigma factor [Chitinophagaceae bacterium]